MIFGFNTDVKYGDTTYHVQSEARENDLLLQTLVFVQGHCIGKRATSYAENVTQAGFTEQQMHELLKAQHRLVLDALREGRLESVVGMEVDIQDVGGGLALKWVNPDSVYGDEVAVMRLLVTDGGAAVAGARLTSRLGVSGDAPVEAQATTDSSGAAEIMLPLQPSARETAVLIQATYGPKSATRKFRLRRG